MLDADEAAHVNVMLLDLDLGSGSMNEAKLGPILRERTPNVGMVIFTQHVVHDFGSTASR